MNFLDLPQPMVFQTTTENNDLHTSKSELQRLVDPNETTTKLPPLVKSQTATKTNRMDQ